ncbi:MAG: transposase [Elusimicrobia bacterium]|nr:transposase [Elusimicrobiota bacterium]
MLQLNPKGPDLWDSILPEEARSLPDDLAHVDDLLRDRRFMEPFVRDFDERTGRRGVPVATYLRLMYLRRRHRLSYDALVGSVSDSIPWRTFCGIGCQDRVPSPNTLSHLTQKYGEETLHELHTLVTDDLEEWTIHRRRRAAGERAGEAGRRRHQRGGLERRLAGIPGVGPALGRLVERARAVLSSEALGLRPPHRPRNGGLRRINRRLLRIVRRTAVRARRLVRLVKDPKAQRRAQLALDLRCER